ncbi:LON peptidase N-terminal domain and RING finger protein 1-like, partial [Aphis craccivora]
MQQSIQICTFYLRGSCRFGNKCWNLHDLTAYKSSKIKPNVGGATDCYAEAGYPQIAPSPTASGIPKSKVQAQGLQISLEASMKPKLKQSNESKIEMEKMTNELSVIIKTENGKSGKESASKSQTQHQQKTKENTENDHSEQWNDVIQCAIDSDLQCNICFEIFIKPTVLNCSHTFCESCIYVWTNRSKKCPICRVLIKSKSLCLTLDSFIEKIVEHLPQEVKHKRTIAIKDRNKIKIDEQLAFENRLDHRLNSIDLAALLRLEELFEAETRYIAMDRHDDINADVIIEESEMFRMNLHDTVVNTRGINPLMSYIVVPDEQSSNRPITRPNNPSI